MILMQIVQRMRKIKSGFTARMSRSIASVTSITCA